MFFLPFFGFDTEKGVYSMLGDPSKRFTLTSINDVASSVLQLSILAAANPNSVPDHVRISGDAKAPNEVAELMQKESGQKVEVKGGDYQAIKEEFTSKAAGTDAYLIEHLR